ncbi:hypothetical protein SLA2020_331990 [Shorea laevis]
MNPRKLSALLYSLLLAFSQHYLLPHNSIFDDFDSNCNESHFSILNHPLSSQEMAAFLSLLSVSRKRKRTHLPEPDSEPMGEEMDSGLGPRLSDNWVCS